MTKIFTTSEGGSVPAHETEPAELTTHTIGRRAAIAAATGTAVEYYEFGVYGYMAAVIAPLFFPGDNPTAALLATLAVFGSAFLIRPLGGIILGRLGDRIGRRAVLLATVIGMGVSTSLIGLLPTSAQIGIWAPILLVLIRLAQGFFAGGEVVGAAAFVAESAPTARRGFFGSATPVGVALGGGTAAAVCGLTSALLGPEVMADWGWRVPFFFCIPLVFLSCKLRHNVEETPEFKAFASKEKPPKAPVREVFAQQKMKMLLVAILCTGQHTGYYLGVIFMNVYMTNTLGFVKTQVFWLFAIVNVLVAALMPFWGGLSDRIGRRKTLAIGFSGYIVLTLPMFIIMNGAEFWVASLAVLVGALPMSVVQAVAYPTNSEQFPTRVRYTALALSFNVATIIAGGIVPYASTALMAATHDPLTPGYFIIATSIFGMIAVLAMKETAGKRLAR